MHVPASTTAQDYREMPTLEADSSVSRCPLLKLPDEVLLLILKHIFPSDAPWSEYRQSILPLRLLHPYLLPLVDDAIFAHCKLDIPYFVEPIQTFAAHCRSDRIAARVRSLHIVDSAIATPYPLWIPDLPVALFASKIEVYRNKVELVGEILSRCVYLESLTLEVAHAATPYLPCGSLSMLRRLHLRNQAVCWDIQALLEFAPNLLKLVLDGVWPFNHSIATDVTSTARLNQRKKLDSVTMRNMDASLAARLLARMHIDPENLAVEVNGSASGLKEALTQGGLARRLHVLRLVIGVRISVKDASRLEMDLRRSLAGTTVVLQVDAVRDNA